MENSYFTGTGRRKTEAEVIQSLQEEGISLIYGGGIGEQCYSNGRRYGGCHIDSCCNIGEAMAITLSRGQHLSWQTSVSDWPCTWIDPTAEKGMVAVFEYAMGNGAAYPQPGGEFVLSVDGTPALSFSLKKSSCLFEGAGGVRLYMEVRRRKAASEPGEKFSLDEFIQNESLYVNGVAYLYLPKEILNGRKNLNLSISAKTYGSTSSRWFRLGFGYFLLQGNLFDGIRAVLHGVPRPTLDGQNIFFGDIHVHTAQSGCLDGDGCGTGSVNANLTYARDVAKLDFCCVTDHDWQLDAVDWKRLREDSQAFNQDGRFVTLHGYEWTSANYGHRNVYFRDGTQIPDSLTPFNCQTVPYAVVKYGTAKPTDPTPEKLWQWLEENDLEAMTIPHHPNSEQFLMDFHSYFHEKYDRCVEVYSCWGCFFHEQHPLNVSNERIAEYGYSRYADMIFGFVASSDGHDGYAGEANVSGTMNHQAHYGGSGRVAVLAEALTRTAVYDAIYKRHCYAISGEPILLMFSMGDSIMGDICPRSQAPQPIRIHVKGTFPLKRVTIHKNSEKLLDIPLDGSPELMYESSVPCESSCSYWVEAVQSDGECAWSSPIFIR